VGGIGGNAPTIKTNHAADLGDRSPYSGLSSGLSLGALSPPSQNADEFARIGTGQEATPIVGIGKTPLVQVVNGFAYRMGSRMITVWRHR